MEPQIGADQTQITSKMRNGVGHSKGEGSLVAILLILCAHLSQSADFIFLSGLESISATAFAFETRG